MMSVTILDTEGNTLGDTDIVDLHAIPTSDRTLIIQVEAEKEIAPLIAGIRIQSSHNHPAHVPVCQPRSG